MSGLFYLFLNFFLYGYVFFCLMVTLFAFSELPAGSWAVCRTDAHCIRLQWRITRHAIFSIFNRTQDAIITGARIFRTFYPLDGRARALRYDGGIINTFFFFLPAGGRTVASRTHWLLLPPTQPHTHLAAPTKPSRKK